MTRPLIATFLLIVPLASLGRAQVVSLDGTWRHCRSGSGEMPGPGAKWAPVKVPSFLGQKTLDDLDASSGFEVGVGPSVVQGDEDVGTSTTTTTAQDATDAFIFDQKGAMAALGIQGSQVTRIKTQARTRAGGSAALARVLVTGPGENCLLSSADATWVEALAIIGELVGRPRWQGGGRPSRIASLGSRHRGPEPARRRTHVSLPR